MFSGTRQPGKNNGLVAQRQLDGNGRPRWLRQVLAVEHEQREDVPGPQRSPARNKVSTNCLLLRITPFCIYFVDYCDIK